jgi:hypothetical protein
MDNKKIIVLVVVIFIALVGYKIISSSIQENKEKAVLEEKAQLDQLAKAPLNNCIDQINSSAENEIDRYSRLAQDLSSTESQKECLNSDHGIKVNTLILSGKMTLQEYCKPPSFDELQTEADQIHAKAKIDIEDCYKRYK